MAEYMLALSFRPPTLGRVWCGTVTVLESIFALRTLRGRLSRLPPNKDDGARARTDASVSMDLRLRLFEEDARVSIEALSVKRLFAVAVLYVAGCPPLPWGARCAGKAWRGEVGNWCENCTLCVLLLVMLCDDAGAGGAAECIVVSVVVKDRTDGAGEEKVLSAWPELIPPPIVADVPAADDAPCEGVASECGPFVDIVGAEDLLPMVGGWCPSSDMLIECLLRFNVDLLVALPVGAVEKEWLTPPAELPLM